MGKKNSVLFFAVFFISELSAVRGLAEKDPFIVAQEDVAANKQRDEEMREQEERQKEQQKHQYETATTSSGALVKDLPIVEPLTHIANYDPNKITIVDISKYEQKTGQNPVMTLTNESLTKPQTFLGKLMDKFGFKDYTFRARIVAGYGGRSPALRKFLQDQQVPQDKWRDWPSLKTYIKKPKLLPLAKESMCDNHE